MSIVPRDAAILIACALTLAGCVRHKAPLHAAVGSPAPQEQQDEAPLVADFPAPTLSPETRAAWDAYAQEVCWRIAERPAKPDCTPRGHKKPCSARSLAAELQHCDGSFGCLQLASQAEACGRCDVEVPDKLVRARIEEVSGDCAGVLRFLDARRSYAADLLLGMAQTPAAIECLARSKHPRARLLLGQWAGDPIAAKVLVDDPRATRAWLSDQIELTRTGHAVDFDSWALWDTFDLLGTEADPLLPGVRALAMRRPKLDPRFHRYDYDAIRRLGTRKDRGAIPMLLEILVDHRDWRAQELAAQSLGEIGVDANASAQALDDVARAHWSTYVRDMSTWAAARVRGEARTSPPERAWDHWPHDERCPMGYKGQGSGDLFAANMRRQRWPWRTTVGEQTITLTDPQHTRPVLPTELREIDLSAHFPDVAGAGARLGEEATAIWSLRRGSVIGTNFGEFGGSLWWISRRGRVRHLAEANVKDIVQVGDALYAVEGLAHLGLDEGSLIRIEATPQGVRAQPVLKLPGNPVAWWVRGDELWVGTEGGLFAIDPDLHIRALPCDADETYPGTIDDEDSRKIKAALARVRPIIDRCLEALPPVLPCGGAFEHGVGIEFRIDASGSVTAAEPSDSFAMRFPEVEACIAARAVGWRFDPPKGGPALLGYIFTQKL